MIKIISVIDLLLISLTNAGNRNEIAKIVGVSVGTVRSRLFYARQQLQADLGEYMR